MGRNVESLEQRHDDPLGERVERVERELNGSLLSVH